MATLAADTPRVFETGHDDLINELPMIADDVIYDGAAVGESGTTGTFRPLVSGDNFAGFAIRRADNAGGGAGDARVLVKQQGVVKLSITGASADAQYGDPVYATDDDTFTMTAGGSLIGEFIRWVSGTVALVRFRAAVLRGGRRREVLVKTDDYTVTTNDSGRVFSTKGATGAVVFSLPPAVPGLEYMFHVGESQKLQVKPGASDAIALPSTGVAGAAGKYLEADAAGETLHLVCAEPGVYSVFGYTGTWTAEA